MRRIIFVLLATLILSSLTALADIDIDFSVDEKLQKKFNTSVVEKDLLPPLPNSYYEQDLDVQTDYDDNLPKTQPTQKVETSIKQDKPESVKPQPQPQTKQPTQTATTVKSGQMYKMNAGTKFMVKNNNAFSSSTPVGGIVTFKTLYPQKFGKNVIPAGTTFKAVVESSHPPQLSGNGGLIILKVYEIIINGKAHQLNAKVILANDKKIFFNRMKGKRTYIKNLSKPIKPASRFMEKMWKSTCKCANGGITTIFAPFPFITGAATLGGAIIISPIVSLCSKGEKLYFSAGTVFNFKLIEDIAFSS